MTSINSAVDALASMDAFMDSLLPTSDMPLVLDFVAEGGPEIVVHCNGDLLYQQVLADGAHQVTLMIPTAPTTAIVIAMLNKLSTDTVVVDGVIVRDKHARLTGYSLHNYDLLHDYDFFYSRLSYLNLFTGDTETVKEGFWSNSSLTLEFPGSFDLWYNQVSKKNAVVHENLQYQSSTALTLAQVEQDLQLAAHRLKF